MGLRAMSHGGGSLTHRHVSYSHKRDREFTNASVPRLIWIMTLTRVITLAHTPYSGRGPCAMHGWSASCPVTSEPHAEVIQQVLPLVFTLHHVTVLPLVSALSECHHSTFMFSGRMVRHCRKEQFIGRYVDEISPNDICRRPG